MNSGSVLLQLLTDPFLFRSPIPPADVSCMGQDLSTSLENFVLCDVQKHANDSFCETIQMSTRVQSHFSTFLSLSEVCVSCAEEE